MHLAYLLNLKHLLFINTTKHAKHVDIIQQYLFDDYWMLTVDHGRLRLNTSVIEKGNGCDVNVEIPITHEHIEIFDMLIELKNCINDKINYGDKKLRIQESQNSIDSMV